MRCELHAVVDTNGLSVRLALTAGGRTTTGLQAAFYLA